MTIRTKLIGAFLLIALLVPVLGGVAVNRVQSINNNVEELSDDAVPNVLLAKEVDALQREQQRMVLSYIAGGAAADRQRYLDLAPQLDQKMAELTAASRRGSKDEQARAADLVRQVQDERGRFDAAANQLLGARATTERNTEAVRVKGEEMVIELTTIRNRFTPTASTPGTPASSTAPITLRNQINELLLGTEGMMSIVGFEAALATGYVISGNEALKKRFEDASMVFANWLNVARGAGGPVDQPIIDRVDTKFYREFEPSARSLMVAADNSSRARGVFLESSTRISQLLDGVVGMQTGKLTAAREDARSAAGSTQQAVLLGTLIAFITAGMLGVWFAGTITQPLRHLRDVAERISTGDLDNLEINVTSKDEVGDLAESFSRTVTSVRFLMMSEASRDAIAADD